MGILSRSVHFILEKSRYFRAGHIVIGPILVVYCLLFESVNTSDLLYVILGFFLFDSLGAQLGSHKLFSHQAFETSVFMESLLGYFAVMSGQGSPMFWAAVHQGAHHKYTDKEQDPHSPDKGFFWSFIGWVWRVKSIPIKSVPWLLEKEHIKFITRYHTFLFVGTWLLGYLLLEFTTFICLLVVPCVLSIYLSGITSYFLHREERGVFDVLHLTYRNFEIDNNSKNSLLLGPISFGTAFHNNHHAHPHLAITGLRWYEFDPSSLILPLISKKYNRPKK